MARFANGDRVQQATYGPGTVTSVDDRHTVIEFDGHGVKTFATALVRLETSDVPAPPKPPKRKPPVRKPKVVAVAAETPAEPPAPE